MLRKYCIALEDIVYWAQCDAPLHERTTWEENDFEGADMLHSVFAEEELPFIHLKPEQLQLILVDRGRQE